MTETLPADGDRLPDGRFAPGNQCAVGRGRPSGSKVAELRAALLDAVSPAELQAVISSLVRRARSGDVRSAELLLKYCLGQPKQHIDLAVADGREDEPAEQTVELIFDDRTLDPADADGDE